MIESLKEQKSRLQNNRPATNVKIVKKIEKKMLIENEINESLDVMEDSPSISQTEDPKSVSFDCHSNSDYNYSDDFEDCSSETQSSIIPKTPEMLRKVREREEQRAAKREEIRKIHQERVEHERERLRVLKEKEIQDEIDERKKTREIWKRKRREEAEKDRRKIEEKERQMNLYQLAAEFHRKLIIKQYGWRPWKKLIDEKRKKNIISEDHCIKKLRR